MNVSPTHDLLKALLQNFLYFFNQFIFEVDSWTHRDIVETKQLT
jgi:hypothetical protein